MARTITRPILRLCFLLLINESIARVTEEKFNPEINSVQLINAYNTQIQNEDYQKVIFEVRGTHISKDLRIKATKTLADRNTVCKDDSQYFNVTDISTEKSDLGRYSLLVPYSVQGELYLCLLLKNKDHDRHEGALIPPNILQTRINQWYHQGPNVLINVSSDDTSLMNTHNKLHSRKRRGQNETLRVTGLRVEAASKDPSYDSNGVPQLLADADHTLRLFGISFVKDMIVTFTHEKDKYNGNCMLPSSKGFPIDQSKFFPYTVTVKIKLPELPPNAEGYFICVKVPQNETTHERFVHQGDETWLQIKTYGKMLPTWAAIIIIITCLSFSSLFSGLNLGLMSMDRTELKILCNTGTAKEKKYAKAIQPVRNHGNYLLCSILLGNVLVNNIFTILLDDLTSGLIAIIFSTLAIVMFGEISPQAVCSRHGLAVGAKTIYITKTVMILTFPLSYPISKCLDWMLGEEIGNVYNRERLKELVKVTTGENDLDKDEVNIISGALELRKKTVSDVMTRIEDVFMLDYESVLDFETVSDIMKTGFSRIPVFEGTRQNIVTMLYIKDLAFVDPDDNTPLKTLCQFYQNPCNFVFEDVTLDVMFRIFKEGNKGHMAFVHRVNNEGEGDPFYETIGLITLEDVIEELIQAEIMDETDVFTDNRSKRKRSADRHRQDFTVFAERRGETNKIRISPQLTLAAYQFLSTSIEQFHPNVISETTLRRLLKQEIVYHIKKNKDWRSDPANVIYQQGKSVDYFILILEGRVDVTVGKENLMFEGGPFTYFGTQALVQTIGLNESPSVPTSTLGSLESLNLDSMLKHSFQPDYTVRASTEVLYLRIKRSLYLAAKRATLMERSQKDTTQTGEQFDEEVDKVTSHRFIKLLTKHIYNIKCVFWQEAFCEGGVLQRIVSVLWILNPSGHRPAKPVFQSFNPCQRPAEPVLYKFRNPTDEYALLNNRSSIHSLYYMLLLHSLEEDDGSTGRVTPRKRSSSKNLHNLQESGSNALSRNASSKTPSLYSNMSPPHRLSPKDINGSIKSSPMDEAVVTGKEEEISLLPKKS